MMLEKIASLIALAETNIDLFSALSVAYDAFVNEEISSDEYSTLATVISSILKVRAHTTIVGKKALVRGGGWR